MPSRLAIGPIINPVDFVRNIESSLGLLKMYDVKCCHPLWNRVISPVGERIAPHYSPKGQKSALYGAVFFDRLKPVFRAGGNIRALRTLQWRKVLPVKPDCFNHCSLYHRFRPFRLNVKAHFLFCDNLQIRLWCEPQQLCPNHY